MARPQLHDELAWDRTINGGGALERSDVSSTVQASWLRSRAAGVQPTLSRAPVPLSLDALEDTRRGLGWVALAERVLRWQIDRLRDSGHVLTLFDAEGRMLLALGNAGALAGLQDIHFMPGALWSEAVVGTNGPGTALATDRPAHIVGAEHYCQSWHRWHCAAVPLHEPGSHELFGALDISGPAERAEPQILSLTAALAATVEQAVGAQRLEQRAELFTRYAEVVGRFPSQPVLLVDLRGEIIAENPAARALPRSARLPAAICDGRLEVDPRHTLAWLEGATVLPVSGASGLLGACVVLAAPSVRRASPVNTTRYRFGDLAGRNATLKKAIDTARFCAQNDLPVLIQGETGVGKEVLAQSIHAASPRAARPFVAINCAALARELVESELFGYVSGAFSGAARTGHEGKFQAAQGGTVFLDELSELSPGAQAALLRVLQEKEITPVGSATPRRVDVRVLAATNQPLHHAVAEGRFRADLYHRLNVVTVELPPLRERLDDLPELISLLSAQAARETGHPLELDERVVSAFSNYAWPGNVRELENLLRRLAATSDGRRVTLEDLPVDLRSLAPEDGAPSEPAQKQRLIAAVRGARNMAEAAAALGVTRSTLYRQMERFGLRPGRNVS